jgi:hypothetical protein
MLQPKEYTDPESGQTKTHNLRNDYTGQVFGKITVLSFLRPGPGNNTTWLIRCSCGNTREMPASTFRNPNNRSCGCSIKYRGALSGNWKGVGTIGKSYLCKIRTHAKRRGIKVDLSMKFLWKLLVEQEHKCALTGLPIFPTQAGHKYYHSGTASLDRIDSEKDYTEDNVQWVHKDVNFMKQDLKLERFLELCELITRNRRNK